MWILPLTFFQYRHSENPHVLADMFYKVLKH